VTSESLGLLIEEARTHLLLRSAEFDQASWAKSEAFVTANAVIAPDGALTAERLYETTAASVGHFLQQGVAMTSGVSYTATVYAKQGERRYVVLRYITGGAFSNTHICFFDLQTGIATNSGSFPVTSFSITPVGNGWYRCSITQSATATATGTFGVYLSNDGLSTTYTGDGFSGIYIWGAQLEAGAFPTSYIPTVAAQATRSIENAAMTGVNFSSWWRGDEGSFVCEFERRTTAAAAPFGLGIGILNADRMGPYTLGANSLVVDNWVNSVNQHSWTHTNLNAASNKFAYAYKVNDFASSINGSSVLTDTSGIVGEKTRLNIGGPVFGTNLLGGTVRKLAYYPARLTNAQLQAITTP